MAYHYSLLTLLRNLALDTPLAYLGLVPFIAILLAAVHGRRWHWEPDVHDRYVDYIIGIPLLVLSLLVVLVVPVILSSFFWRWRLDLLTLPVFVTGAVTLVFGLRTTLRMKIPIAFLFLAWPLPYTLLASGWLQAFTDATISGLRQVLALVPVARPVAGADPSLFLIPHGSGGFVVSVGSACAGVNGSLGFLLVGTAMAGIVGGGIVRKALWLFAGMVLTWALNVQRILLIFAAGNAWGQNVAINALHPFVGLVTFNVGVLAIVLALPLFGLRLTVPASNGRPPRDPAANGSPPWHPAARGLPVRRAAAAMLVVAVAGMSAGAANEGMRAYELVAQDLGQPRLAEWSAAIAHVDGWTASLTNSYPWVEQYFGRGASWNRYAYLSNASQSTAGGSRPLSFVNVDVISTWDLGTFSTYGLEACYGFHNYEIEATSRVDLGAGVVGRSLVYYNPSTATTWTAVYWEWPVQGGGRERYERIILNSSSVSAQTAQPAPSGGPLAQFELALASVLGDQTPNIADPGLARTRDFLVGFAHELVMARSDQPGTRDSSRAPGG